MARVVPFRGMRYSEKVNIRQVVSPPYDIISAQEQSSLYRRDPHNVIRLEYGKTSSNDTPEYNRYTRAATDLNKWLRESVLAIDEKPAFYIYQQNFRLSNGETKSLRGIIGLVELTPFSDGIVLPHEETLSKAKSDRFNLMAETFCNFSQIYSLYLDENGTIRQKIDENTTGAPEMQFTTREGITQKLWMITNPATLERISAEFSKKQLYIADGHHRYETAVNFKKACPPELNGGYVMMFLADMEDDGLVVFPTHRMVSNLELFNEREVLSRLEADFEVTREPMMHPEDVTQTLEKTQEIPTFAMYTGKNYFHKITLKNFEKMKEKFPESSEAYRNLDVNVLHALILEELFGIDMENMANQKNLTYTRVLDEAINEVQGRRQQCSFLLNPTKVREIRDVAIAGEKMPQKSTYFWPKLVTGLVMNKF